MTISRYTLYQAFKYSIYAFLAMNVYWFFAQEHAANVLLYPDGVGMADLYDAYTAAIDTAAWVVLLLMFELETYILDDRHFTKRVTWSLHLLRAICYALIVRMFFGYIQTLGSVLDVGLRDDTSPRVSGKVGVSLIAARGLIEGRAGPDQWYLAGRRSWRHRSPHCRVADRYGRLTA